MSQMFRYIDELVGDEYSSSPRLRLLTFNVLKTTSKGAWIYWRSRRKFVLLEGRKRFAHPTREEALTSFIARKRRQKMIYAARHDTANEVLEMARALVGSDLTLPCDRWLALPL